MFDKNVNIGSHNRAGRDQFITVYINAPDYQKLEKTLTEQQSEQERLVQRIRKYPDDEEFKLELRACNVKIADTRKEIEDFKENVFRLYELFTRIPINTERLRLAKAHFDRGEFREADAVLKAEEINAEVSRLKAEKTAVKDRLAAIDQGLADKANEFLLKALLSLLNPAAEGESRFKRTEQYFEQALAAARTAEVLHNYAVFLHDYNALSRAETLYQEALQQMLRDEEAEPKVFLSKVATTLNNLANLHSKKKEYEPALEEYEEALNIYRSLAEAEPKVFLPDVAMILNNLAVLHADTKEYDLALDRYEEALTLYQNLAEAEPKTFLPGVAMTMNNLANLHANNREYELALKEYDLALKIRRYLAETEPKAFLSDVADTLNNLANLHQTIQSFEPALQEYEEALKLYRSFAKSEPEAFLPKMATTLNNLAVLHSDMQSFGPALEEHEEALQLYRSLVESEPKAFLQEMAVTLIKLSSFHIYHIPDRTKSVAYAQEARSIFISLCKQAPHLQRYLDAAEIALKGNKATPAA